MSSPSSDRSSAPQFWQSIKTTLQQQRQAPPLQPVARDQSLPLSFAQERLWFLHQLYPDNLAYQTTAAYRLHTAFNLTALEQALIALQQRHEILRTTFPTVNGKPIQAISTTANIQIPIADFSSTPPSDLKVAIQHALQQAAQKTFNLAEDLPWRVELLQLSQTDAILLLSLHHIIYDAWSLGIFYREFTVFYNHFATGAPLDLSALPIQYADFAAWQRQWLQGEVLQSQIDYWQQQLDQLPVLQLPTDRPRPKLPTGKGAMEQMHLSPVLTAQLKAIGQTTEATLFMALLTVFKVLLYRYTQQTDLVVGTPIANRNRAELQGIMGFFTNTLVLRTAITGEMNFKACLEQVQSITLDAYAHQDLPFEKLVEVLQPERDLSRSPLFQVMLTLQNIPEPKRAPQGLIMGAISAPEQTTKFDLNLFFQESNQGVTGLWEYSSDLFDAATIKRMQQHFLTLLTSIVAEPDRPISQLSLLTITEQYQLLVNWNQTQVLYPSGCLHQLFEAQAAATPDAIAAIFDAEVISYQSLNEKANQLAHYLQTLGVKPGEVVGLCIPRSIAMLVGLLGILKAGAAYLPLDPAYPINRLEFMMTDAQLNVLITHQALLEQLPKLSLTTVCLETAQEQLSAQPATNLSIAVQPHHLSYVIYTSGSTGQPKGVAMPHRSIVNLIHWQTAHSQVGVNDRTLQFTPLSFDVSAQEIFATWNTGGTLVLITEDMRCDPILLLSLLETQKIARLFLPFIALQQLAEAAARNPINLPDLRELMTAGEQLRMTPALQSWLDRLPDCTLQNQYGPSESHVVTAYTCDRTSKNTLLPPIGRPIANTEAYVLDENQQLVPIGVPGELYIAGMGLAHGYIHHPELTIEKFIVNPFFYTVPSAYSKLYKTGDRVCYRPDGNLEFLGRIDHQLKIRGYRVEPEEIAAVLSQHPQVQEVAIVLHESSPDHKQLVAYVVLTGETLQLEDLRSFLKPKLPDYMLPAVFVPLETLPLTPSGKIDYQSLAALPLSPSAIQNSQSVPFWLTSWREKQLFGPQNITQEMMAQLWGEVLDLQSFEKGKTPFNIFANFFELGGHSLAAAQLMQRIEDVFQVRLPLQYLFENPTIFGLANYVTAYQDQTTVQSESEENAFVVPLQTGGTKTPFFLVTGGDGSEDTLMYYAKLIFSIGQDQPVYGLCNRKMQGGGWLSRGFHSTVESLASDYLQAIRTVQPNGPYLIGGECMGGNIAFEIAQQLQSQDQSVALLLLLDTLHPQQNAALQEVLQQGGPKPDEIASVIEQARNQKKPALINDIAFAHSKAINAAYQPQVYPGQLTMIVAQESIGQDPTLGWGTLAANVQVHVVPGNHDSYIGQYAQSTTAQVKSCLEIAQRSILGIEIEDVQPNYFKPSKLLNLFATGRDTSTTQLCYEYLGTDERLEMLCQTALKMQPERSDFYLELARTQQRRAQFDMAIENCQKAVCLDPHDFWVYWVLGDIAKSQEKWQEAIEYYKQVTKLNSDYANAYIEIGNIQCRLGQFDKAIESCQKAITLNPEIFWAYWVLGDIAKRQEKWQEAIEYYKQVTKLNSDYANAYIEIGNIQYKLGRFDEAIEGCQKAITLNPETFWAYWTLGSIAKDQEKWQEVAEHYKRTTEIDPNYVSSYIELANAKRKLGQLDEAIESCKKAITLNPEHFGAYWTLGDIAKSQENWQEAVEYYNRGTELNPGAAYTHFELGNALYRLGKLDEAVERLQKAITLNSNHFWAHWILGSIAKSRANWQEVAEHYKRATEIDPNYASAYIELANAKRKLGQLDEAIESCKKAITLNPEHFGAYWTLGDIAKSQENWQEAAEYYNRGTELNPDAAYTHFELGNALYRLWKLDEAVERLQKAITLNSNHFWAHWILGSIAKSRANWQEVAEYYKRATEIDPNYASAYIELGNAYRQLKQFAQAIDSYQKGVSLGASHASVAQVLEDLQRQQEQIEQAGS